MTCRRFDNANSLLGYSLIDNNKEVEKKERKTMHAIKSMFNPLDGVSPCSHRFRLDTIARIMHMSKACCALKQ